ncbi:hypothetical protein FDI21_gp182 [Pseudomonas phage Noxifer]|uniref:Uncharacterized protein n=1 Tax=Pseudomonas phage Noxifer TaxID=2006684 RepID=A0A1Y0SV14_9CAUD|nr:hypothetical protein FDI21_gp182 [Pseudomonas phage Noxifer]ARV77351.1 hypothetical protein NOXIFER_182 [Pseudomonas phage Noxifer]
MKNDVKEIAKMTGYFMGVVIGLSIVSITVRKVVDAAFD